MKNTLKNKKILLISADLLLIPVLLFCRWLSEHMLAQPGACIWTLLGGQCITCGGTHFVNTLLNGQFIQAFQHNELLFIYTVILALSYILLHLWWFGNFPFAKKILSVVYSIPGLIIFCCSLVLFLLIRNIPVIVMILEYFLQ